MSVFKDRYTAAGHRVQTAIAYMLGKGSDLATPKHLRVGVNMAMAEHAALAMLLVDKGVITLEEYEEQLADFTEKEADRCVQEARDKYNFPDNADMA